MIAAVAAAAATARIISDRFARVAVAAIAI